MEICGMRHLLWCRAPEAMDGLASGLKRWEKAQHPAWLRALRSLAEGEGFEPPLPVRVNMISSHALSAGLSHPSGAVTPDSICAQLSE